MAKTNRSERRSADPSGFAHSVHGFERQETVVERTAAALQQHPGTHLSAVSDSWGSVLARAIVRGYQLGFSPWMTPSCRFIPSCSEYALQAYASHPFGTASWLTVKRLCKCNPWGSHGFDPVPFPETERVSALPGASAAGTVPTPNTLNSKDR